jgi:hypothetical protein
MYAAVSGCRVSGGGMPLFSTDNTLQVALPVGRQYASRWQL